MRTSCQFVIDVRILLSGHTEQSGDTISVRIPVSEATHAPRGVGFRKRRHDWQSLRGSRGWWVGIQTDSYPTADERTDLIGEAGLVTVTSESCLFRERVARSCGSLNG
jgi:hypothetical protein